MSQKKKSYKIYELQKIMFIKKSFSANNKITYWAKVDQVMKRVSQEYFFLLKVKDIKIVSLNSAIQKAKCLAITRQGFQCSRSVLTNKKYCFQHLKFDNTENKLKDLSTKSIFSYKKKKKITFIDLFSGMGSFHYVLKKFDAECVLAVDNDKRCNDIYYKNFGVKSKGDILDLDINSIPLTDILCGGFPCQPFSIAGLRKGFLDKRSNTI